MGFLILKPKVYLIPQSILNSVFKENTIKGSLDADKVPNTKNIFQTTDIISSIVSDPFELGNISAKHALNDILASNTKPLAAQMIVSLPPAINEINKRATAGTAGTPVVRNFKNLSKEKN